MVVVKSRNNGSDWEVMHKSLPANYGLRMDTTSAQINIPSSTAGGGLSTSPTANVISFISGTSNANNVNESGKTWVAYAFSEVSGFSKFGSYTGNGSTDGPFVYTGFKPRFILAKRSDAGTEDWFVLDTARDPYNQATHYLTPDSSATEGVMYFDALANGFKMRGSGIPNNTSGATYIYAAFAEQPFGGSNVAPATAR
jgi:hypothetical protein